MRVSLLWTLLLFGCSTENKQQPVVYNGPLNEAEGMVLFRTEKDKLKVKMKTTRFLEFANGDQEFPSGVYIEFYNEDGSKRSDLRANHAHYFNKEQHWRGRGNVIVRNLATHEKLTTEELYWEPGQKKIFTEKFVTIQLDGEVLYGTGLDAAQDMSSYTIKKPAGEFQVKE